MVCFSDEEVKFEQFMFTVNNVTRCISRRQRRIVSDNYRRINYSGKYKHFKKLVDANFMAVIRCECLHAFYTSLSLFVEQVKVLQKTRYSYSYTFVLSRLIALLSLPHIKVKIPNIVKVEICVLLDYFLDKMAFRYDKKTNQFIPNYYRLWFPLFLEKHAYAFGRVYAEYKVVSEKLTNKI